MWNPDFPSYDPLVAQEQRKGVEQAALSCQVIQTSSAIIDRQIKFD